MIYPRSNDWEVVDHKPSDDDVFVVLDRFQAYDDFSRHYRDDKVVCSYFKVPLPKVLGYKTTKSKPVDADKRSGRTYQKWRADLYRSLDTPENRLLMEDYGWFRVREDMYFYSSGSQARYRKLSAMLGDDHALFQWLHKVDNGHFTYKAAPSLQRSAVEQLAQALQHESEAKKQKRILMEKYPLLLGTRNGGIDALWGRDSELWVDYVKLIDQVNAPDKVGEENHEQDSVHCNCRVDQPRVRGEVVHGGQERAKLRSAS
jgi:hypothetical protein